MLQQAFSLGDLIKDFNELNEGRKGAKQKINFVCLNILILTFIIANASNSFRFWLALISLRVQVSLSQLIYRKSLKLSKSSLHKTSVGQIANLLSVDMTRINGVFFYLPMPFIGFILIFYAIFKLWPYLHHYTLYGVLFLFLVLPIQSVVGRLYAKISFEASKFTDERMRLVDEFINAIKIIKIYCWEHPFSQKIKEVRKREIAKIRKSLCIFSISIGLSSSTTKTIVFIILATFYSSVGIITDRIAFLCLNVFSQTTFLITYILPQFILKASGFWVTIKRVNKFLTLEEKHKILYDKNEEIKKEKEYDLLIKNMTACFSVIENLTYLDEYKLSDSSGTTKKFKSFDVLKKINLNCKKGELVIVVGPVGSGKSSLFQAILSDLKIREGSIEVNGKLSYASQESWIFGGTIRENILFDSDYDEEKYNEVIKVCALERDLKLFADGDESFIGERGIVLSGGQKARVSLARSLYYEADIYLLDDPLSAVDSHVAKHIFKNAIKDYLKNKTVILITHQLNYIKYADKILFIKKGEQLAFDNIDDCLIKFMIEPDCNFTKFIGNNNLIQDLLQKSKVQNLLSKENSLSLGSLDTIVDDEENEQDQLKEIKKMERERKLKEEEDNVRFVYKSYLSYFRYANILLFISILIFGYGGFEFFSTFTVYFLKLWTDHVKNPQSLNQNSKFKSIENEFLKKIFSQDAVYFYSTLILSLLFVSFIRTILFAFVTCNASVSIHKSLFERIVRAQMKFFYDNPVGVILNRFSRDIGIIDGQLNYVFHNFIESMIETLGKLDNF